MHLNNEGKLHFPALDGLRFLAFLGVFCYHGFIYKGHEFYESAVFSFFYTIFQNGNTGVNVFYVLSGFLIFYLLLKERSSTGSVNFYAFYIKRILRIWPLYFICIAYGFYLYPVIKDLINEPFVQNHNIFTYLTFTNNFETAKEFPDCFFLSVLWSIAVEFQFYLLAPVIVKFAFRKHFITFMLVIIAASLIFRVVYVNNYSQLYFNTISVMSDFAIGGLAAYTLLFNPTLTHRLISLPPVAIRAITAITIILLLSKKQLFQWPVLIVPERLILASGLAFIIINLISRHNESKSKLTFIQHQGKYTYGLYCYHIIAITTATFIYDKTLHFQNDLAKFITVAILAFILVMILSRISYHLFEKHFLKLKPSPFPSSHERAVF